MFGLVFITGLVSFLMIGLIFVAVLVPDESLIITSPNNLHVFRLPTGARRISNRQWRWNNETVIGIFQIYTGSNSKETSFGYASTCCETFDAKLAEPLKNYEVETLNDGTFTASAVIKVFYDAVNTWESVIGNRIGSLVPISNSAGLSYNLHNQIGLGTFDVNDAPNALAITAVWITCPSGGSVNNCPVKLTIGEWDQTYDFDTYSWSLTGSPGSYDFPSIATHELGHSVGLGDLLSESCIDSTMYGYSDVGETFRRSLDGATKTCVKELYGIKSSSSSSSSPLVNISTVIITFLYFVLF